MRAVRTAILVAAVTLLSGHVAPSVDDNNRYVKLTPLGDRIRVAYTVLFGEIPGATERRTLDANHDGHIDDAEARAFGDRVAALVAAALELEVDGKVRPVTWATVDVGLGTPDVDAGAFAVDLVTYACLPGGRGRHVVTLRDRFRVPHPGETEARVEDSPGVTIERAHVGSVDDPANDFRFAGPGGPLEEDGLELVFVAGPNAPLGGDAACAGETSGGGAWRSRWWWIGGAAGAAIALAVAATLVVRGRRRRVRAAG